MRAPGVNNSDFSISKTTQITEMAKLLFRVEFFNIFNRVQFTDAQSPGWIGYLWTDYRPVQ